MLPAARVTPSLHLFFSLPLSLNLIEYVGQHHNLSPLRQPGTRGKRASHECLISPQECLIQSVELGENEDLNMHHKNFIFWVGAGGWSAARCPTGKDENTLGNFIGLDSTGVCTIQILYSLKQQSSILFTGHVELRHFDLTSIHFVYLYVISKLISIIIASQIIVQSFKFLLLFLLYY